MLKKLTITKDNKIWIATDYGASYFDGEQWTSYNTDDGLTNANVYKIAIAEDGTVWFGTYNGVSHFDPTTNIWTSYNKDDGLAGSL